MAAVASTRGSVKPGIYVFREDELGDFLAGRLDAAATGDVGAQEPGVRGIALSARAESDTRALLAKKDGFYKAIVWKPSTDVWAGGWEPDATTDALKKEILEFDAQVRVWPIMRGMREACRRTHALARRDGRALLLIRLREGTGEPVDVQREPRNVAGVHELRPVPRKLVKKIHMGPDGAPSLYEIYRKPGDESTVQKVHPARVIPFIPAPNDDDPGEFDGESDLDALMVGAESLANIKWALSEAYYKFGKPYLVAVVDKEFEADEDSEEMQVLDERLEDLKLGKDDKIRTHGATLSLLHATPADPSPFVKIHREDASAATGIPMRELTGSEAGALEAAQWDSRRYDQSVVTPTRDSFGSGVLLEWYQRLQKWGLLKSTGHVKGIIWYPYVQIDERERGPQAVQLSMAMKNLAELELPVPKEWQALITMPEGVDLNKPLKRPHSPAAAAPPPGGAPPKPPRSVEGEADAAIAASSLGRRRDQFIPLREVVRLEDRVEKAVRRAFRAWHEHVADVVERATGTRPALDDDQDTLAGRMALEQVLLAIELDDAALALVLEQVLLAIELDDAALALVLEQVLIEAAELGVAHQASLLGAAEWADFLNSADAPTLRQFAREYSAGKARRASHELRTVVAEVLGRGGGTREVVDALRERFQKIENTATIARTEVMRGFNTGAFNMMHQLGLARWRFTAFPGADEACTPYDGQTFPLGTGPAPPVHPNCRCIAIGVLPHEEASS